MRHARVSALRLLVVAALVPTACSRAGSAASPRAAPASPAADQIVAEVAGRGITLGEVDKRAAGGLQRLAQEEFELRRQAVEELVSERLLEQEAKSRGVTPEALLKAEVTDKVKPPTPEQVRTIFERSRDRLGDRPFAEVAPHIERSLMEQAHTERQAEFNRQLRSRSTVRVSLAPPRATVVVPADAPALGPPTAPVTIVGFLDYQCPYCHRSQATVDRVV